MIAATLLYGCVQHVDVIVVRPLCLTMENGEMCAQQVRRPNVLVFFFLLVCFPVNFLFQ